MAKCRVPLEFDYLPWKVIKTVNGDWLIRHERAGHIGWIHHAKPGCPGDWFICEPDCYMFFDTPEEAVPVLIAERIKEIFEGTVDG